MKKVLFALLSAFLLVSWTTSAEAGGRKPVVSVAAPALVEQRTVVGVDVSIDKTPGNRVVTTATCVSS